MSVNKSGSENKVLASAIDRLINRKLEFQVHFLKQQTNKEINMNKPEMPAVKRRKLEKQKKIKAELRQELEREKMELLEYMRDRSKTASIVDDHIK
jgi:hypothetical protein